MLLLESSNYGQIGPEQTVLENVQKRLIITVIL